MATQTLYVCMAVLCCFTASLADSNREALQGLFSILSSSPSGGEPRIRAGVQQQQDSEEVDSVTRPSVASVTPGHVVNGLPMFTTEVTHFNDSDVDLSQMTVPDPQRVEPILRARLTEERELEKSHNDAKQIRLNQIKSTLLRKLNLDRLPDPAIVERYLKFPHHILQGLDGTDMQMDEPKKQDNYHAKIDQMIRFSQQLPQDKMGRVPEEKRNSTLYFPMPFSVTESSLHSATLLVYIYTPDGYEGEEVTLNILTNPWLKSLASKRVILSRGGHWEHIDITDQCKSWLRREWRNNLGLVAEAEIDGIDLVSYNNYSTDNNSLERLPLVKLKLNEKGLNRNKRSASSDMPLVCDPEDNESRCCRYPFVMDFQELGRQFDFILSPRRYWANYCKGTCPEYVLPSNINLQLTRNMNPAQRCCTPSAIEPLTLIYLTEDGDILRGTIPGMSIASCGCD